MVMLQSVSFNPLALELNAHSDQQMTRIEMGAAKEGRVTGDIFIERSMF
jgi:hypothetical protein